MPGNAGHYLLLKLGRDSITMKRINRGEENFLRKELESLLKNYRDINQQMSEMQKHLTAYESIDLLRKLHVKNNDIIQMLGRYISQKCNRCR